MYIIYTYTIYDVLIHTQRITYTLQKSVLRISDRLLDQPWQYELRFLFTSHTNYKDLIPLIVTFCGLKILKICVFIQIIIV